MKLIHTADLHLGANSNVGGIDTETRLSNRTLSYLDIFDSIIDFAEDEKVDLFLFAGDMYHTSKPNMQLILEMSKRTKRLSDLCPVVILIGNHDYSRNDLSNINDIYTNLNYNNVTVCSGLDSFILDIGGDSIGIIGIPYIKNINIEALEMSLLNELDRIQNTKYKFLLGHFTVQGSIFSVEKELSLGIDDTIPLDILHYDKFDYVALGHIHKQQKLQHNVYYSGSPDRITYNEQDHSKGFMLYDTEKGAEFIETDAIDYYTIKIDLPDADMENAIKKAIEGINLRGSIVRIFVYCAEEGLFNHNFIHDYFKNNLKVFHISGIMEKVIKTYEKSSNRCDKITYQNSDYTNLLSYFDFIGLSPDNELLDMAKEIMEIK